MLSHEHVLQYGRTYEQRKQPLILIVGREANCDTKTNNHDLGTYDFDQEETGRFCNVAYRYIAPAAGITDKQLKSFCTATNSSPIIFSDALPTELNHSAPSVNCSSISADPILIHIERTLAFSQAIERVKLIVLSGHLSGHRGVKRAQGNLKLANEIYKDLAGDITVIDTAFMSNLNSRKLREQLSGKYESRLIKSIIEEFFELSLKKAA